MSDVRLLNLPLELLGVIVSEYDLNTRDIIRLCSTCSCLWELRDTLMSYIPQIHMIDLPTRATLVSYSSSGMCLFVFSDHSIRMFNSKNGYPLKRSCISNIRTECVSFSTDRRLAAACIDLRTLIILDLELDCRLSKLTCPTESCTRMIVFSSDNRLIALTDNCYCNTSILIWDIETKKQVQCLSGHIGWIDSVVFSQDRKLVTSGGSDKTVWIWNIESGKQRWKLGGHTEWVRSVAFSPDSKLVVSGSDDRTIRIWNVETGKQLNRLNGHTYWVRSVVFSPDGQYIASCSADKTVRIWDTGSGQQLLRFDGHTDWVRSVTFSPDGKRVASCSDDRTVRIWNVRIEKK